MPRRPRPAYYRDEPLRVFGDRVRSLRVARGWSQEELGHRAGRHWTYIGALERGERNATCLTMLNLGAAFDVDPGVFLTTDERTVERAVKASKPAANRVQNMNEPARGTFRISVRPKHLRRQRTPR